MSGRRLGRHRTVSSMQRHVLGHSESEQYAMNRLTLRDASRPLQTYSRAQRIKATGFVGTSIRKTSTQAPSRIARIEARLPRFLQKYVKPLRNAPISHITSFLILHELTAIIPLFGLTAFFHYANWLPPYITEGAWVNQGVEKFGKYLRKKGWLGEEEGGGVRWWGRGEGSVKIVVELATAYAITKALLPLRLIFSVWATPWFARATMLPAWAALKRLSGKASSKSPSPAAGTGATGGGVLPKTVGSGSETAKRS